MSATTLQAMPVAAPQATVTTRTSSPPRARLVLTAYGMFALAAVLLTIQHLQPTGLNPVTKMLSDYAYHPGGWLFTTAIMLAAYASGVMTVALVRSGLARHPVQATLFGLWSVCLLVIAVVQQDPSGSAPTLGGDIHRTAVLVGFLSLPIAALAVARTHRVRAGCAAMARAVRIAALGVLGSLTTFMTVYGVLRLSGRRLSDVLPLGLIERQALVSALVLLLLLGLWSTRVNRR
ncbi:DUF998 domain-containing protein [Flindersiella endophytica]